MVNNLIDFFHEVAEKVSVRNIVDVIDINFQVVDKVPYTSLVHKVVTCGNRVPIDGWIGDWLNRGKQRAMVVSQTGGWETVGFL